MSQVEEDVTIGSLIEETIKGIERLEYDLSIYQEKVSKALSDP